MGLSSSALEPSAPACVGVSMFAFAQLLGVGLLAMSQHMPPELSSLFEPLPEPPPPARAATPTPAPPTPPRVHMCGTNVSGRLPPESIQRVVRLNSGRFRACYAAALRQRPGLTGRAQLRFRIARDGTVARSTVSGLDHAPALADCMTRATYAVTFPQPEGGYVEVVYPWVLTPVKPLRAQRQFGYR